ncbi:uncharacterized protein V1518DRAFT_414205 [Limtongia smithiae]|uniref:uncharacterized protein n=1 Tax=Limtongia smithiae TaxID=1125753 RepID=UPI0034CF96C2
MSILAYLRKLKYRYYVTMPLLLMTKTERIIFNLFMLISLYLLCTAVYLYFPSHVKTIVQRSYYYYAGAQDGPVSAGVKHTDL